MDSISRRCMMEEGGTCDPKERSIEKFQSEEERIKRLKKNEHNIRDLWDSIKSANICVMWVSAEEQMKGTSSKFENKFNFIEIENLLSSSCY